jgi:ATP-dependent DNA helicase UvrD/PcrA
VTSQDASAALDQIAAERAAATERILASSHPKRVIVAGPGTGKTHVFKEALDRKGGNGLALTFIKKLASDLADHLGGSAETYTFHKFAKILVYRLAVPGLTPDFVLYPPFNVLTNADLEILGRRPPDDRAVERQMQDLEEGPLPAEVLRLGTYYDAASFVDVVYRVFGFLETNTDRTPTYPLVVVDEYQDFTRLETAFIAQLGFGSPLLIAGDDDQALYDFRFATPEYIRALARSEDSELHSLPYCSRCTVPVVDAVNTVIGRAIRRGNLADRLDKPFRCYLPDKLEASRQFPLLTEASCTTRDVMARYVEREIDRIPSEDVEAAAKGGHLAALVVGPGHFIEPVYQHLKAGHYPDAKLRRSDQITVERVDAYRQLARDAGSNLGWRILLHLIRFDGYEELLRRCLTTGDPLTSVLPDEFRREHIEIAGIARRGFAREALDADERARLATGFGIDVDDLDEILRRSEDPDAPDPNEALFGGPATNEETAGPEARGAEKTVLCTTLQGAKGLSAEHVFIVGLMGGHLPRDNANPTDKEICEFLVALSRTRTSCHLVSVRRFGAPPRGRRVPARLPVSEFVRWVAAQSRHIDVAAADLR